MSNSRLENCRTHFVWKTCFACALEWLVVVNQVNQSVTRPNDLPQAYQNFSDMIKYLSGTQALLLAG